MKDNIPKFKQWLCRSRGGEKKIAVIFSVKGKNKNVSSTSSGTKWCSHEAVY